MMWTFAALIILIGSGCASLDETVSKLTSRGKYEQALTKLERAGVGEHVDPEATPEAIAARVRYENAVASKLARENRVSLESGLARRAAVESGDAVALCRWSATIAATHRNNLSRVAAIDKLAAQCNFVLEDNPTRDSIRPVLRRGEGFRGFLGDSPEVDRSIDLLESCMLDQAGAEIANLTPLSGDFIVGLQDDFSLCQIDEGGVDAVTLVLEHMRSIAVSEDRLRQTLPSLPYNFGKATEHKRLRPVTEALALRLQTWILLPETTDSIVNASEFCLIDALFDISQDVVPQANSIYPTICLALRTRAQDVRADDRCAPLGRIYCDLAQSLGDDSLETEELRQSLDAILSNSSRPAATFVIEIEEYANPVLGEFFLSVLYSELMHRTLQGATWQWVDATIQEPDVQVTISAVDLVTPQESSLPSVTSRHYSHHENVPNPAKSALANQLESARFRLESSERSYDYAVSSHNTYPTQFSLNNVNTAKTAYLIALNRYNSLVTDYNLTPATIPRPVYLPYSFRQGTLSVGVKTEGRVIVDGTATSIQESRIESDFARFGSKANDEIPAYRRADPNTLDSSLDAQLRRIYELSDEWVDSISNRLLDRKRSPRVSMSPTEIRILNWIDSPLGPVPNPSSVPQWITGVGAEFAFPEVDLVRELIRVPKSVRPVASDNELLRCCVEVYSGSSDRVFSRGSGSLVSRDGLILTCEHVLRGPNTRVRFFEGPLKGDYPATIVQINSKHDVALIRAEGIESEMWLDIDMRPPARGTAIEAVGSPSLNAAGGVAHLAITTGTLVTPDAETYLSPRLVSDVTVASGSSGGPLLDRDSRRVIGVVTAVAREEFTRSRSSTGNLCLAAPASMLHEWLGVICESSEPAETDQQQELESRP